MGSNPIKGHVEQYVSGRLGAVAAADLIRRLGDRTAPQRCRGCAAHDRARGHDGARGTEVLTTGEENPLLVF